MHLLQLKKRLPWVESGDRGNINIALTDGRPKAGDSPGHDDKHFTNSWWLLLIVDDAPLRRKLVTGILCVTWTNEYYSSSNYRFL